MIPLPLHMLPEATDEGVGIADEVQLGVWLPCHFFFVPDPCVEMSELTSWLNDVSTGGAWGL